MKKKQVISETLLTLRMPDDLYKQIEALAAAETRTISNMIRVLLVEALRERKGKAGR